MLNLRSVPSVHQGIFPSSSCSEWKWADLESDENISECQCSEPSRKMVFTSIFFRFEVHYFNRLGDFQMKMKNEIPWHTWGIDLKSEENVNVDHCFYNCSPRWGQICWEAWTFSLHHYAWESQAISLVLCFTIATGRDYGCWVNKSHGILLNVCFTQWPNIPSFIVVLNRVPPI